MSNTYRENLDWMLVYGSSWDDYLHDSANNLINATAVSSRSEADNVAWLAEMVIQDEYQRLKQR